MSINWTDILFYPCLACSGHLLGGVVAHGVHDVAEVEQVKLTLAIPVVDVTDLLDSIGINHDEAGVGCWAGVTGLTEVLGWVRSAFACPAILAIYTMHSGLTNSS